MDIDCAVGLFKQSDMPVVRQICRICTCHGTAEEQFRDFIFKFIDAGAFVSELFGGGEDLRGGLAHCGHVDGAAFDGVDGSTAKRADLAQRVIVPLAAYAAEALRQGPVQVARRIAAAALPDSVKQMGQRITMALAQVNKSRVGRDRKRIFRQAVELLVHLF